MISSLEVHSLINIKGKKWLVINNNKFNIVRILPQGRVLWRCMKTKYCPAKVCTSNIEDNIVTFAKLKHDHSNKNQIRAMDKRLGQTKSMISSQGDLNKNMEGSRAKEILPLNQVVPTIKKEPETDDKVPKKLSSSESAPGNMNLAEIIFPYMLPKDKVEIVPGTGVFISESGLNFIKEKLKDSQLSIIRNLLRHLLGPQNLKYLNLIDDREAGTTAIPDKVFIALQLFLTQNCSKESNHLSINCFIQCIKETFEIARIDARFAESTKNSTDYGSANNFTNDNDNSVNNNLKNRRKRRRSDNKSITNSNNSMANNSSSICELRKSADNSTNNSNNSTVHHSTNRRNRQKSSNSTNNSNNDTANNSTNQLNRRKSSNNSTNNSNNATANNSTIRRKRRKSANNSTNNSNNSTASNSPNRCNGRKSANNSTNNSNNATANNSRNRRKRRKSANDSANRSNNSAANSYTNRSKRRKLSTGEFYSSEDQTNSEYIPSLLEIYAGSVNSNYFPSDFYGPSNQGYCFSNSSQSVNPILPNSSYYNRSAYLRRRMRY